MIILSYVYPNCQRAIMPRCVVDFTRSLPYLLVKSAIRDRGLAMAQEGVRDYAKRSSDNS